MKLLRITEIVQTFLLGMLCLVTLLVSGLGASTANAASYVTADRVWQSPITYWYLNGRWDWSSENTDTTVCNLRVCRVYICNFIGYGAPGQGFSARGICDNRQILTVRRGATAIQTQQEWASKYGTSGTWEAGPIGLPATVPLSGCVGFAISVGGSIFGDEVLPITSNSCGKVPPPNLNCTTSGKITIDYGTLDGSKLNGATASTTLSFTCNQAATATIKLNDSVIDLGRKGDLTAAISIGGKDLATGSDVAVKSGTVTTTITSTLKAKGTPAAGAFEGSGVLIIGYQ